MKNYLPPVLISIPVNIEQGFAGSNPDMGYGDGGDAWDD